MSRAATSLRVFSLYMFALGLTLILDPNLLLSVFGFPLTREVWIRIVGMLALILGYYDLMASRTESVALFQWSVHVRLLVPIVLGLFVALHMAPPILIVFGVIDGAAAVWTAVSLRRDSRAQAAR
ncbi:MAG: hypothetical protein HIU85_04430 [Proteobacteria bacterium]|nr:hypothetical protein [Pseudomonadota bacterium]